MADFNLPRVPHKMDGYFMLMPEESKENRAKRDIWFREQADKELRKQSSTEVARCKAKREGVR